MELVGKIQADIDMMKDQSKNKRIQALAEEIMNEILNQMLIEGKECE